jgi:hypothetical protein
MVMAEDILSSSTSGTDMILIVRMLKAASPGRLTLVDGQLHDGSHGIVLPFHLHDHDNDLCRAESILEMAG